MLLKPFLVFGDNYLDFSNIYSIVIYYVYYVYYIYYVYYYSIF